MSTLPRLSDPTYRIEAELGAGGGGVVYKAWHTRLEKYVVLKELKSGSRSAIETRRNEVEALKHVKSEFIPQVFDFLTEGERIFTVMEFIEGESLDRLLERGEKFSQPQVVKWYGQLVSALTAIHAGDVCHRDIKPANIMLMPNGNVCLIDFNAALVSGNDAQLISRSLGYASPEQYEIYEFYKKAGTPSPINLGTSGLREPPGDNSETEIETELLGQFFNTLLNEPAAAETATELETELAATELLGNPDFSEQLKHPAPASPAPGMSAINWKRSDIYSLGATMYHLLSGKYPPERAAEVIPVSKVGRFSEGIVYVIEQSMKKNPAERFASAEILSDAVSNIHKHDTRWKIAQSKKIAAAVILPLLFALCAAITVAGYSLMAQEREERFYIAVFNIRESLEPLDDFDAAREIFFDRIDPFYEMSVRLWNDGDILATREFIEANLGNIAQFQSVPEAARAFGNIYFILGNTYYFQLGEPNYHAARGNFEIALQFLTDNPLLYRDYAITLARTGDIEYAERMVEIARGLNIEADSLNLLHGEISFARREFDNALYSFAQVIYSTGDDNLRYRAFHTSDEIYRILGHPERSAEMLAGALNRIPLNRVPEMTERLAEAYVRIGNYDAATELFEQLAAAGAPQFNLMYSLAQLLQNAGDFDRAADVLAQMADFFPRDYRIPMRKTFFEAERQAHLPNEERDYALTMQLYIAAVTMYRENLRPGAADPEMQQLSAMIEQLRVGGWFSER
ncbi:MAG: serine/threonine-protein kinase [Defluviitaleaceae bacterium]|nr:serine/threonine-protein kinase [Defluviitaleaceae bacterium]